MTKTIEEVAKSIANDFIKEHKCCINNDAPLTHECVQYAIERILAMSLIDRMTKEEKERVRKIYHRKRYLTESREVEFMEKQMLKHIFGKELFEEER